MTEETIAEAARSKKQEIIYKKQGTIPISIR
jgi:hypothetical protein